ncbi:MAG: rod shape-determining protein MreD [Methylacidiphilales bacterium]|nr:rod shape-determining protein MreD [Candidatus Methylacidiphilales bacterium]
MRFLIVLYLLFVGVAALLAQMILPPHYPLLSVIGFGSAMIPLVVIYASLEVGDERALALSALLGLLVDLTSSHRLGTSVLTMTSLSALIVPQAQRPEAHLWFIRLTFVLVGTFLVLLLDYMLTLAEMGRWLWPLDVWSKITFASLLNVVLCPFFFFLVGFFPRRLGWKPVNEQLQDRAYVG